MCYILGLDILQNKDKELSVLQIDMIYCSGFKSEIFLLLEFVCKKKKYSRGFFTMYSYLRHFPPLLIFVLQIEDRENYIHIIC